MRASPGKVQCLFFLGDDFMNIQQARALAVVIARRCKGTVSIHGIDSCQSTMSVSLWRTASTAQVRDAARSGDGLNLETLLEPFQAVPHPLAPAEDDRHDGDVQIVDQIGGQELPDGDRSAA